VASKKQKKFPLLQLSSILVSLILIAVVYVIIQNPTLLQNLQQKPLQQPQSKTTHADWKIYTNPDFGYLFEYPTDWQATFKVFPKGPGGMTYYSQVFEKDGYKMTVTPNLYGVGGAINRYVAITDAVNINGATLYRVYLNLEKNNLCTFSNKSLPNMPLTVPPSACTNTFDWVSLINPTDIFGTRIGNAYVFTTGREYPCFSYPTWEKGVRFEVSLKTPKPISISDTDTNPYVIAYNHLVSTIDFSKLHGWQK
jgi:hypothetical protein